MNVIKAKNYILKRMANELPKHCYYHSIEHTEDVLAAATELAALEGLTGDDIKLLKTAATYHDSGFMVRGKDHEAESCKIARAILPEFDYTEKSIEIICGIIMATQIPQTPTTHLEKIICDADLDYLGRDDYEKISNLLIKEMRAERNITEKEWLEIQIRFLSFHNYQTASSQKKRSEKKLLNLQKLQMQLLNL